MACSEWAFDLALAGQLKPRQHNLEAPNLLPELTLLPLPLADEKNTDTTSSDTR